MVNIVETGDAGFGTASAAELRHLTPGQLDRVRERVARQQLLVEPVGSLGVAREVDIANTDCIGTEAAGEPLVP